MPNSTICVKLPPQTLVIQVSIKLADLPVHAVVPAQDDHGRTQAQPDLILTIPYGGSDNQTITARLKGRSFRRLMNEIGLFQNPPEKLVLTGRLTATGEIEGAGFLPYAKDAVVGERELVA